MNGNEKIASASGIPIKSLYTPSDINNLIYKNDLGLPGKPPFTRGVYEEMYRKQLWTQRQVCGYGTADDVPQRVKDAIYLFCGYRYENRIAEDGTIPTAFYDLLRPQRLAIY